MTALVDTWSNSAPDEDGMTQEHAWIWQEMIKARARDDLSEARVLDIGCNQGGFLRMLYDALPFKEGVGVDLAQFAVATANAQKRDRPLTYKATTLLADAGDPFDLAFSHEVIYLIDDLEAHAHQVAEVLASGGTYDAVTCCHSGNPLWSKWHPMIAEISNIPVPDHHPDAIAAGFRSAGLEVSVARFLANAPIPMLGPNAYFPTDMDRVEVYANWKLLFRCTKP